MSQKLSVNNFEWIEKLLFNQDFIKSHEEYFLEVDVQYSQKLQKLQNDLPFFSERMEIKKVEKLITNFYDKMKMSFT